MMMTTKDESNGYYGGVGVNHLMMVGEDSDSDGDQMLHVRRYMMYKHDDQPTTPLMHITQLQTTIASHHPTLVPYHPHEHRSHLPHPNHSCSVNSRSCQSLQSINAIPEAHHPQSPEIGGQIVPAPQVDEIQELHKLCLSPSVIISRSTRVSYQELLAKWMAQVCT